MSNHTPLVWMFAQGQSSVLIRCMAAWISWGGSSLLTQTTLKRDFLPPCSTHIRSPDRMGRVIPDSKAPLLLSPVATTFCVNEFPLLSMPLIFTTRLSFLRGSLRCSIPSRRPGWWATIGRSIAQCRQRMKVVSSLLNPVRTTTFEKKSPGERSFIKTGAIKSKPGQ